MYVYKFTVKATMKTIRGEELHDTSRHYIVAYSWEHANDHLRQKLTKAGWKIEDIKSSEIFVEDIRDKCDHITD